MSILFDLHSLIKVIVSLYPQTVQTTAEGTGAAVDTKGFHEVEALYSVGAAGDTWSSSVKVKLELHESDASGSGFAAAADTDLIGPIAEWEIKTGKEKLTWKIGYKGSKRYVKPVFKLTGTHTVGTILSSSVLLGKPDLAPPA